MIRGIGFDLGDTLIQYKDVPLNWQCFYQEALGHVLRACHVAFDETYIEKGKEILNRYNTRTNPREIEITACQLFTEILQEWRIEPAVYLEKAVEAFYGFFQQKSELFDDTLEILEYLKGKGIKTGILTDVPYGMPHEYVKKDILAFEHLVDCLLTSVEVGYRKPCSLGYVQLAEQLGVALSEMLYVGNEEKDIVGAISAKMNAVLLNRIQEPLFFGETYSVISLCEIKDII